MSMLAMSWNDKGLGRNEKRKQVRKEVLKQFPTVLFVQESKLVAFDSRIIKGMGGTYLTRGIGMDALGSAGGLFTLWNKDLVTIKDCILNNWCIILVGVLNKIDKEVVLCNVYAINLEHERREL